MQSVDLDGFIKPNIYREPGTMQNPRAKGYTVTYINFTPEHLATKIAIPRASQP